MASATPPNRHPTRARIVDTTLTTQTRIRNGQPGVAQAVRPLEESCLWLAVRRRVHAGGMCMPTVVATGSTRTLEFRVARTPYKSQLRVVVMLATSDDATSGPVISITTTTDAVGQSVTAQVTNGETVLTAVPYRFLMDAGDGDNADLGTEDVTVEITGPGGAGSQCTVYSVTLMWEPLDGPVVVS